MGAEEGEYEPPPDLPNPPSINRLGLPAAELDPEVRLNLVVGWLLKALDRTNYKVVFVEDLETYRGAKGGEDKKEEAKAPPKKVTVVKTGKSPTYKPPVPPASKPADTDFKDFSREELEQLRKQNNGKKAREHSTVYTTEKALSYAFYGIANEEVFNRVMENLDVLGAKGTFFITRKDLLNHADRVKEIAKAGHEIGICLTEHQDKDFYSALNTILIIQREVSKLIQQTPTLVRYPYYIDLRMKSWRLCPVQVAEVMWQDLSIASSRVGPGANLEAVLDNAINDGNLSVRRGYIVYYRMDYYKDPNVIPDAMLKIAENRIDTIAYEDGIEDNGSAYTIKPIGEILKGDKVYNYPLNDQDILALVKDRIYPGHLEDYTHLGKFGYIKSRYIGNPDVSAINTLPGFTEEEVTEIDKTGRFTDDPVLFNL